MELQNYEKKDLKIKQKFKSFLQKAGKIENKIKFSWSNWGFGLEPIEISLRRLKKYNVNYIEVFGNRFGDDLGYNPEQLKKIIADSGIKVSGVCGMVSRESELSSTSPSVRQRCIDYFKRNIELCKVLDGEYLIFHPGAVGRPEKYDDFELERAIDTINIIADYFVDADVKGAIEPVRADEVSTCHTFQEVVDLINSINHSGIRHIAGDVYHMLHGEEHIGETIINYSDYLVNLHMADTNRMALGSGMLNLDIVIMALYLIRYNEKNAFCSAEPLGSGADPYIQMNGPSDSDMLDKLVKDTASYFYKREALLLEE